MNKIVIGPTYKDHIGLFCSLISGLLLVYVGYLSSWNLSYDIQSPEKIEVVKEFEVGFGVGFILLGLIAIVGGIELFARKVKIDEKIIESISPLRIYNPFYRIEDVSMARLTPISLRGRALELLGDEKWIVFVSNEQFKDTVFDYFPDANAIENI